MYIVILNDTKLGRSSCPGVKVYRMRLRQHLFRLREAGRQASFVIGLVVDTIACKARR